MIKRGTWLNAADNSGAVKLKCIGFVGLGNREGAGIGDVIVCSVKKALPRKQVSAGQVVKALVVRQRRSWRRQDGSSVRFEENAAVLLKSTKEILGNRIFGPIPRELRNNRVEKIVNLAQELV
ncbi:MAG: 50S ribosomal protein L14 [Patescibacteria group bacterium]|nr:50S ribosomal protein L14 [Patescibacteria group bacterium]MCL5257927.1 50S ribosomal protein L14 [Patescibacteria group bacterium]